MEKVNTKHKEIKVPSWAIYLPFELGLFVTFVANEGFFFACKMAAISIKIKLFIWMIKHSKRFRNRMQRAISNIPNGDILIDMILEDKEHPFDINKVLQRLPEEQRKELEEKLKDIQQNKLLETN